MVIMAFVEILKKSETKINPTEEQKEEINKYLSDISNTSNSNNLISYVNLLIKNLLETKKKLEVKINSGEINCDKNEMNNIFEDAKNELEILIEKNIDINKVMETVEKLGLLNNDLNNRENNSETSLGSVLEALDVHVTENFIPPHPHPHPRNLKGR
jgi:TPP-dependent indolepyruvate ferredoxin oxidoreductase alpha subunit